MNFLKTLFWIALTVVVVVFATNNWNAVTLNLWAGLQADAKLPVLLLIAFLIGFLPTWGWYRAKLWQLRRKVETTPRAATPVIPATPATPVPAPATTPVSSDLPDPAI